MKIVHFKKFISCRLWLSLFLIMTTLLSRYHDLYIVAVSYGSARTVTVIFFFFFQRKTPRYSTSGLNSFTRFEERQWLTTWHDTVSNPSRTYWTNEDKVFTTLIRPEEKKVQLAAFTTDLGYFFMLSELHQCARDQEMLLGRLSWKSIEELFSS